MNSTPPPFEHLPHRSSPNEAVHLSHRSAQKQAVLIYPFLLGSQIDWDAAPQRLQAGDLSALDREVALAIQYAAMIPEVAAFARQFGLDPVALVIGLLARCEASISRSAARLAKAIFGDIAPEGLDRIAQRLGLKGGFDVAAGMKPFQLCGSEPWPGQTAELSPSSVMRWRATR